jgi:hypothetical protein
MTIYAMFAICGLQPAHLFDDVDSAAHMNEKVLGILDPQMATLTLLPLIGSVSLK